MGHRQIVSRYLLPGLYTKPEPLDQILIRDCDIALWEPTTFYGEGIARATGGPFSHTTAIVIWHGEPWSVGFEEKRQGHACPLRAEINRHPDRIHLFRVKRDFDFPIGNVREALLDVRGDYLWSNIKAIALLHLLKWVLSFQRVQDMISEMSNRTGGGICSQHVSRGWGEQGGVRFTQKPYEQTTPNDIGFSPVTEYISTPIPGG